MVKDRRFGEAKSETIGNLISIRKNLSRSIEEGMLDPQADHYNELLLLEDEADISKTWDELMEVITKAKILEVEVAAWLSGHGRTSVSFPWPRPPIS